jgi:RNA polymerase sigma factor (sigma-70 family)
MTQALLTQIASGDMAAVGEFLRRHTALVFGQARRFCRNAQDAEDAVQDIFLEIWRSAGRYDPAQGSEVTFVATIARRRLVDRLRRQTNRPAPDLLEDPGLLPAKVETDSVDMRDEAALAREAMQKLRPEQREVLELALGHGRSHQEIAASVGIPLGTVKSHARRGLIRLRQMLGVEPAEGGLPGGRPASGGGAS